jgi:hypothetical protein
MTFKLYMLIDTTNNTVKYNRDQISVKRKQLKYVHMVFKSKSRLRRVK